MTTGAVIIAHDNESLDYQAMARWSAGNIRRHLGIPVAVITDKQPERSQDFDRVIIVKRDPQSARRNLSTGILSTWYNKGRPDVYDLSPWDRTLLLDADYVVASDQLAPILQADQDILAYSRAHDITGRNDFAGLNAFGEYRMPVAWATVVMFRKSQHARLAFKSMAMIRQHWHHYMAIYKVSNSIYRNDYALSIALGIVNGHLHNHPSIPGSLTTVMPDCDLTAQGIDNYRIDYIDGENRKKWIIIKNTDFHAMNKKHLGDLIAQNSA